MSDRLHDIASNLEICYERILRERMQDIPILNHAIRVEAVGFHEWQDKAFGILITPWFMNIVVAELDEEKPDVTASFELSLPAGRFDFLPSSEEGVGSFAMCSLSSPMFDYEDHAAAVATAHAALDALFVAEETDSEDSEPPKPAAEPKRVSRRELFTGLADAVEQA